MVLLIDANILLDVLMNRKEFVTDSSMIWKLCETEQAKGYISVLTYANIMYIMRKQLTPEKIEEVFHKLNLIFEFADFSPMILEKSVNMKWSDFEDAVQGATAEAIHADYIVTRKYKRFCEKQGCCIYTGRIVGKIIKILIK